MKVIKAPRNSVSRNASSIPALLLLGTLSGTALAATGIETPCPESASAAIALQAIMESPDPVPGAGLVRTVDASETLSTPPLGDSLADNHASEIDADADSLADPESPNREKSALPELTSSLPGIAVNDLPGFRRHMFRTDI